MEENKKSQRILFVGGSALLLVIVGVTLLSFRLSRAQQGCVASYFWSNLNGGCVYDQYDQAAKGSTPTDFSILGGTNAADRAHWNFTAAKVGALSEDGTKRYVTTKCGSTSSVYCSLGAADCSSSPGSVKYAVTNSHGGSNERCVVDASLPVSNSAVTSDIICLYFATGQPTTEVNTDKCKSSTENSTVAIRCSNSSFVISRDSQGYDKCVSLSSVANYERCSIPKLDNSGSVQIYMSKCPSSAATSPPPSSSGTMQACGASGGYWRMSDNTCQPASNCWNTAHADYSGQECQGIRRGNPPPPPPPPSSAGLCPRKPDPAKGTAGWAIPDGYEIKEVPSYYLWGCYSQPDKSAGECTPQATKRTGNTTSPCVAGEESINGPAKGTAYLDGNFLKWGPLKKKDVTPEPTVITQTIHDTVTVEVPTPEKPVNCQELNKEIGEKIVPEGNVLLELADKAFEGTDVKNPEFKKNFSQVIRGYLKSQRKLKKASSASDCGDQTVDQLNAAVREDGDNRTMVIQSLVVANQGTKIQNQYLGIRTDFQWIDNFLKMLKPEQGKMFREDVKAYRDLKNDFDDLLEADKEGKVFAVEFEYIVSQTALLKKDIESKVASSELMKQESKSLKKSAKTGTKKLKKAAATSKKAKKKVKPKTGK